jgi:glucosyl-3-phosphoglycerate synthase
MSAVTAGVRTVSEDALSGAWFDELAAAKASRTVSVCLPCKNEAGTVGQLVRAIRMHLVERSGLVDELIVLDDRSTDGTAAIAARAGARVVPIDEIHAVHGPGHGKGNALWASLLACSGDLIVWCDGDVTSFKPEWVARLLAPLLHDDTIGLVKAAYHRPTTSGGGGRTTELVARPLLSLYFPELADLAQPLAGEYAVRRSVVEQIPLVQGWGVEIAMLIDVAGRFGASSIAEVDLGVRRHRHHPLLALSVQAAEVMATALGRTPAGKPLGDDELTLRRADGSVAQLNLAERPPLAELGTEPQLVPGARSGREVHDLEPVGEQGPSQRQQAIEASRLGDEGGGAG